MTTCSVSNLIKDISGNPIQNCNVIIELVPKGGFKIDAGSEIASRITTTTDVTGTWTAALELPSNINPANSYYKVTEQVQIELGNTRIWNIVPVGVSAILRNILVSQPTAGNQIPQYLTKAQADALYLSATTSFLPLPASYLTRLYGMVTP